MYLIIRKIFLLGKVNNYARPLGELKIESKKSQEIRTSFWPRAKRAEGRKINGRRCAPPTKWLFQSPEVRFWCGYTTLLELSLLSYQILYINQRKEI